MKEQDHYTFFLLKPSALKRRHLLIWTVADQIKKLLLETGFKIIKEKKIMLSNTDIIRFYKDEIHKIAESELFTKQDATVMFKSYKQTLQAGPVILLLVYHPGDAKSVANKLKGDGYMWYKNAPDTIRYMFRDKRYDNFKIPKGKIMMLPFDNVVHCPRIESEFYPIIKKYFPEEYRKIKKKK